MAQTETWKPVVGYEGLYEVSDMGRVRSVAKQLVLQQSYTTNGYLKVRLYQLQEGKTKRVNRLVAFAHCSGYEIGMVTNHKNGIKTDNRASNLEWVTSAENNEHALDSRNGSDFEQLKIES